MLSLPNQHVFYTYSTPQFGPAHMSSAELPHEGSGYWIQQYWSRAWLDSGSIFLASNAETHGTHYFLLWGAYMSGCPIFSAPKIDHWI